MKVKLILYLLLLISTSSLLGQEGVDRVISDKVSDCDGATSITQPGSYELEFTGNAGLYDDLAAYTKLAESPENNSLWTEFVAPFAGELSLSAYCSDEPIEMILFSPTTNDACADIFTGRSEIQRIIRFGTADTIGLKTKPENRYLTSLRMKSKERVFIYFNIRSDRRKRLNLSLKYAADSIQEVALTMKKVVDLHYNTSLKTFSITLQDASTGLPVNGQLYLKDGKDFNAMYRGTNFLFDINRDTKVNISVDAEGYFFYDRTEVIKTNTDTEVIVWLEPLAQGKQIEIPGIEFLPGTSEFSPGTEAVLRRLRNFLLLNSTVKIEIQGHVHSVGESSLIGKRLSYARARQVMNFLIESGVDKNRMTAVGYGNEFMKYPEPKFSYEEQANRRVEIKIL